MVSVIVPFWNSADWLGRCINSLRNAEGDAEFILVDDHSNDRGYYFAIWQTETDDRFKVIQNERAKGVSGARNTGLDHAQGDWVTFLDADDELLPDALKTFDRMTRLDSTANITQANHLRYYEQSGKTVIKYANPRGVYNFDKMPACWCMVWNKLIRREFIEDNKIRFIEGLQYGEDEIFVLECMTRDERIFHTLQKTATTVHHFENKGSLSRIKGRQGLIEQVRALEDFLMRTENSRARIFTCELLAEHWSSPTFFKEFGGLQ